MEFLRAFALFLLTAAAEIGGCYLPYLWLRKDGTAWLLVPAAAASRPGFTTDVTSARTLWKKVASTPALLKTVWSQLIGVPARAPFAPRSGHERGRTPRDREGGRT